MTQHISTAMSITLAAFILGCDEPNTEDTTPSCEIDADALLTLRNPKYNSWTAWVDGDSFENIHQLGDPRTGYYGPGILIGWSVTGVDPVTDAITIEAAIDGWDIPVFEANGFHLNQHIEDIGWTQDWVLPINTTLDGKEVAKLAHGEEIRLSISAEWCDTVLTDTFVGTINTQN